MSAFSRPSKTNPSNLPSSHRLSGHPPPPLTACPPRASHRSISHPGTLGLVWLSLIALPPVFDDHQHQHPLLSRCGLLRFCNSLRYGSACPLAATLSILLPPLFALANLTPPACRSCQPIAGLWSGLLFAKQGQKQSTERAPGYPPQIFLSHI